MDWNQREAADASERLSPQEIEARLTHPAFSFRVYDRVTSTNALLKDAAASGAREGLVILASQQTDGYGRLGRPFFSPGGTGVYMSVLLRPSWTDELSSLITAAAAVAVAEAIEELSGKPVWIKWVNDLLMDGRKVCGILAEGVRDPKDGRLQFVALGIGVNVTPPPSGFPEPIRDLAGAVFPAGCANDTRSRLIAGILNRFQEQYSTLDQKRFLAGYRSRSALLGQPIVLLGAGNAAEHAVAIGIDDLCRLVVRMDDGRVKTVGAGEVRLKWRQNDGSTEV